MNCDFLKKMRIIETEISVCFDWSREGLIDQPQSGISKFESTAGFGSFPPKIILSVATSYGRAEDYDLISGGEGGNQTLKMKKNHNNSHINHHNHIK